MANGTKVFLCSYPHIYMSTIVITALAQCTLSVIAHAGEPRKEFKKGQQIIYEESNKIKEMTGETSFWWTVSIKNQSVYLGIDIFLQECNINTNFNRRTIYAGPHLSHPTANHPSPLSKIRIKANNSLHWVVILCLLPHSRNWWDQCTSNERNYRSSNGLTTERRGC